MDARMIFHNTSSFMSDAVAFETRKASVLRNGALPDAPFAMPMQVIEVRRAKTANAAQNGLSRLLSSLAHGFGLTARGR